MRSRRLERTNTRGTRIAKDTNASAGFVIFAIFAAFVFVVKKLYSSAKSQTLSPRVAAAKEFPAE
jgi:hypothetical protein